MIAKFTWASASASIEYPSYPPRTPVWVQGCPQLRNSKAFGAFVSRAELSRFVVLANVHGGELMKSTSCRSTGLPLRSDVPKALVSEPRGRKCRIAMIYGLAGPLLPLSSFFLA